MARRRLIPAVAAAWLLLTGTASADPVACRKAIVKELLRFTTTTLTKTGACVDAQNTGTLPGPCPDPTARLRIDDAKRKTTAKLAKACLPADVEALGYTDCHLGTERSAAESATCGPLPVTDGTTLAACLTCWKGAEAAEWLATLYASHALELCGGDVGAGSTVCPAFDCGTPLPEQWNLGDPGENACQRAVASAGLKYVVTREKTLASCGLAGGSRASCLADPTVEEKLARATLQKDTLITKKCNSGSATVTWWHSCPQDDTCPGYTLSTLADVQECIQSGADDIADRLLCSQLRANGGSDWPCNTLTIAGLAYRPGDPHNVGPDIVVASDPFKPPSHTMTATLGDRAARIGVDDMGGGYIMHFVLAGTGVPGVDGQQVAIRAYGRGWQGSTRSAMHCCQYNPTQAGYTDDLGAPVQVVGTAQRLLVPQFQLPLFFNDVPQIDDRIRTEYDFSARTLDATAKYGLLAFDHVQYYAYVRPPHAMTFFTIRERSRIQDISPTLPGDQTATNDDVSDNAFTPMGLRLTAQFAWVHYRQNGAWVSKAAALAGFDGYQCGIPGSEYPGSAGPPGTEGCGDVDHPLIILSTSQDPSAGVGVGLYFPVHDGLNGSQTHVIDGDALTELWRENRSTGSVMMQEFRDGFYSIRARSFLTGSFSPANTTALNGRPSFEVVTDHTVILVGTPDEILAAVVNAELEGAGS